MILLLTHIQWDKKNQMPGGLYDMHGNVGEYCNDWSDFFIDGRIVEPTYYSNSPLQNPTGPVSGTVKIVRGGSYSNVWYECRSSTRSNIQYPHGKLNGDELGFRVVRSSSTQLQGLNSNYDRQADSDSDENVLSKMKDKYNAVLSSITDITVDLTGEGVSKSTAPDEDGYYIFSDLLPGNYTVSVSSADYTFKEVAKIIAIIDKDIYGVDFISDEVDGTSSDLIIPGGIVMVPIPDGTFQMGEFGTAIPVHQVTINSFQISKTEITQGQYEIIVGSNPSQFQGNNNHPVEYITWYDAVSYCNKLSVAVGLEPCYDSNTWDCDFSKNGFRLPTEAEWEYACRALTTGQFYTGSSKSAFEKAAWYGANSANTTHPVGEKQANEFGLFDMHGNVFEWCNDWFDVYTSDNQYNPIGPSTGSSRINRGGDYKDADFYCRSSSRGIASPNYKYSNSGFRVVIGRGGVFPPSLEAYELSPATPSLVPGGSFTARYQIKNLNSIAVRVKLDLRYRTMEGNIW